MIKNLIKKQESKALKIFTSAVDFGKNFKFNPEICAENISDKMVKSATRSLNEKGFTAATA